MNVAERQALFENTARQIGVAAKLIQERHIANCTKADPGYGAGVAQAIARLDDGRDTSRSTIPKDSDRLYA
jgi:catalase